jgi:acetyl-CoA C-acetyltransferase
LGSLLADYSGVSGIEAITVEAACASGSSAMRMAYQAIAGGAYDVAVVCGVEQLAHADRSTTTRALATAADWELEASQGETFITLNAALMRAYMDKHGASPEAFAPFSIAAHRHAMQNPNALFHKAVDLDGYLASRLVHAPLRLFDISPICDGAAAVVLACGELARGLNRNHRPPVRIAGSAAATAPVALQRRKAPLHLEAVELATRRAMKQAAIKHRDIDFLELHDAYTIMTVLCLEASGFAPAGQGPSLGCDGRIALDGDLPLSTFGGLKARGHPVGATGVYQLAEAYLQLTARAGDNQIHGAETAMVQNVGGVASTVVVHILQRTA